MLIVYRKSDKKVLFNSGISFIEMSDINGKLAVIEQIGGNLNDYGTFRISDTEEKQKVDAILNAYEYDLVFDNNDKPIDFEVTKTKAQHLAELPPLPPTQTEILQQDVGHLLLESAADKAKLADLEALTGALLLEIATLKGGTA